MGDAIFNSMEIDMLGEILNISLGASATSASNRKVSLIGNHTWATGALGAMKKKFETEFKKIEIVGEPLDLKSALRPEQEEILDNLAEAIVESMK